MIRRNTNHHPAHAGHAQGYICLHCIVPPYMIDCMADCGDEEARLLARLAMQAGADARAVRRVLRTLPEMSVMSLPSSGKTRMIYDAQNKGLEQLPGKLVRGEGTEPSGDEAVDEAYEHSGITYDFYQSIFSRNSLDNKGMALLSSVHVGRKLNNAFWTGQQMAYGDGDGRLFTRFTKSLDVVAHELTHGVITHESNLVYQDESGALNEHFADVFGVLTTQWAKKQSADKASWLVGADVMGPGVKAKAIRSFKAEKAYENDPFFGTDPQPKHLKDKYTGQDDNGGVHINSGIPNHAFYLFATKLGGNAWETAGAVWYTTLKRLSNSSDFADMVQTTTMVCEQQNGAGGKASKALAAAWRGVGL
jgi:Zn-dependent metalloprotease